MSKVTAKYIGSMTDGDVNIRLYNIEGPHRLAGSTVTIPTLLAEMIPIEDMTTDQINDEFIKIKRYLKGS